MQAPDPVEPIAWTLDDLGGFGSGCTPGTAASLPDGTWAGFVELAGTGISFDLACVSLVNAGDGTPHPSIENNNPMLRLLNVGPDLLVIDARNGSGQAQAIPLEELDASYHSEAEIDRLVFVQVSGGVVTVIQLPSLPPNG